MIEINPDFRGRKVKFLNVIGQPIGTITRVYEIHDQYNYDDWFWVRLENGMLLKDVHRDEVEFSQ
jgi:hypothetical protein